MSYALPLDAAPLNWRVSGLGVSEWRQTAVSDAARQVRQDTKRIDDMLARSQALFGAKREAIDELHSIASECGLDDWDGDGALALQASAVDIAERFIRVLPGDIPMPEIAPEPDGAVGLDWCADRYRMFSVSIGGNLRLAYAWLDGTDQGHAVARFDGETIPGRVLDGLRALLLADRARAAG